MCTNEKKVITKEWKQKAILVAIKEASSSINEEEEGKSTPDMELKGKEDSNDATKWTEVNRRMRDKGKQVMTGTPELMQCYNGLEILGVGSEPKGSSGGGS